MKKIILSLLFLLIISLGVACASAADNATMTHDSIQVHDSQKTIADSNVTVENDVADAADNGIDVDNITADITPHDGAMPAESSIKADAAANDTAITADNTTGNHTATGNSTPKLDIKGPKNDSGLKLKGPKGNPTLGQKEKEIFHCAKVYSQMPFWNMFGCIKYVFKNYYEKDHYSWMDIATIVAKAHNIAYCKTSKYIYYDINKELTPQEVYNYMLEKSYFFYNYFGRKWG